MWVEAKTTHMMPPVADGVAKVHVVWQCFGCSTVELQKDVLMPILSFEVTILVDPARSHSQAAQASAAAKIRTPRANRKLVKFHKDICSQSASSHYQAKQALLATQQR